YDFGSAAGPVRDRERRVSAAGQGTGRGLLQRLPDVGDREWRAGLFRAADSERDCRADHHDLALLDGWRGGASARRRQAAPAYQRVNGVRAAWRGAAVRAGPGDSRDRPESAERVSDPAGRNGRLVVRLD